MEQNKETIYQFNADEYIKSLDPELHFFERLEIPIDEEHFEIAWEKISVGKVWVTTGPNNCQIHADIRSMTLNNNMTQEITPEQYRRFLDYKGEKRRLNMVCEIWKGIMFLRKEKATKHVDLRVTPDLYDELSKAAKECKKTLSDYCRDILKGKVPRAALSDAEEEMMMAVVNMRNDLLQFRNALKGELAKIKDPNERVHFLIAGQSAAFYQQHIKKVLIYLDGFINRQK